MAFGHAFPLLVGAVLLASSTASEGDSQKAETLELDGTQWEQRSDEGENSSGDTLSRIYSRCGDSLGCTLWELANVVDGISARESLDLFSGMFRVEKKMGTSPIADEADGADVQDSDVKEITIEVGAETLATSVERFLKTHIVHLSFAEEEGQSEGRMGKEELTYDLVNLVQEDGRSMGRSKLRRFLIPLLIGFKLKAGFLFPLFFSSVAIIALKALGAGLTALLLASVLGLKAIVDGSKGGGAGGGGSKISVEVVKPHPVSTIEHQYHHAHHHVHPVDAHWAPGWGRDGDEQAYKGYYYGDTKN